MRLAAQVRRSNSASTTIVFIHAFPLNSKMWSAQMEHLSPNYSCIAVDLRGYGESRVESPSEFSFVQFAGDVIETLDAYNIGRAILAGCSMGGYTIFEIWRRAPERVAGMILCDTRAEPDADASKVNRQKQIDRLCTEGAGFMLDFVSQNQLCRETRERRPEIVRAAQEIAAAAPVEALAETLRALANRRDSGPLLPTINVPTLIIVGREDELTPVEMSERMHREISDSQLVIIPDAAHLAPMEQPGKVNAAIESFLPKIG